VRLIRRSLAIIVMLAFATSSSAQNVKTTTSAQSVSRATFNALQDVQVMMDAEQYDEALVRLEELVIDTADNPYDFALANQYVAHVSVILDNPSRARTALQAALSSEELPPDLRSDMNLFYGTILIGDEEYELAVEALEDWFALAMLPQPAQIFSVAYANYQTGRLPRAEELADRAIGESVEPLESWYQLYYRTLFEQKKYAEAEGVLKGLIERAPLNPLYWRMLASHHFELEGSSDGLAALMIAHSNDLLDADTDLRQIVSLWGYIDAPEKGARMLEGWLDSGRLEADAESLKQLGNLWLMSRERDNATAVLARAAAMEPDGRTYEMLGGIYFEDEEWLLAYDAYQNALRQGDLEESARVSLLAGISAYRAGNEDDARRALEVAAEDDEMRQQAEGVLRQLR
jgi:tetratricopeptide (TPR) repeat protein